MTTAAGMANNISHVAIDAQNPWPGLGAFDEAAERFFNGRSYEAAELRRLVLNAPLTAIFGASGLGKTSLIQAGLFPLLRKDHVLPVYVRLNVRDSHAPLIEQVKLAFQEQIRARHVEAPAFKSGEQLWEYLHRAGLELWSERNQLLTPLFVFDQFEEVFTIGAENPAAIARLRIDLADLIENRMPTTLAAIVQDSEEAAAALSLDSQRYKVLLSFREDFLPAVEGWKRELPSILRNRVRLLPMSGEQAFEAVHKTAPHFVDEPLARQIVRFVAAAQDEGVSGGQQKGDDLRLEVEPALLSLVCHGLNEKRKAQRKEAFDEALLSGTGQSIISDYYGGVVGDLPARVQRFIERELITERGFRKPCDIDDARSIHGVSDRELRLLVDRRLLRIEPYRGTERVELTHDLLTRVVREHRDLERVRGQRRRMGMLSVLGVVLAGLAAVFGWLYLDAKTQRQRAEVKTQEADVLRERAEKSARDLERETDIAKSAAAAAHTAEGVAEKAAVAANAARGEAERQASIATSGRLATAALLNKDGQLDLASLLSLEANRIDHRFEARNALFSTFQSNPRLRTYLHHSSAVTRVTLSLDGRLLASGTQDGRVLLWDVAGGRRAGELLPMDKGRINRLAFSPDSKILAAAGRTVRLWEVSSRTPLGELPQGQNDVDIGIAFSPDGNTLVSASHAVRLWDVASRSLVGEFSEPARAHITNGEHEVVFSLDGKLVATAGGDGLVRLWDVAGRQRLGNPISGLGGALAFSPDGETLASISRGDLHLTDRATLQTRVGGGQNALSGVTVLAFSPNGKMLAFAGEDGPVRLWDAESLKPIGVPFKGHARYVNGLAFSSDGRLLASGGNDRTVRLWDLTRQQPVTGSLPVSSQVDNFAFSPDGKMLATAGEELPPPSDDPPAPRQRRGGGRPVVPPVPIIEIWDVAKHERLGQPLKGHNNPVTSLVFSPNGKLLASTSSDSTVRLWDAFTHQPVGSPLQGHDVVAFSPDGKLLAAAGNDESVRLWAIPGFNPVGNPLRGSGEVRSLAFSKDGEMLTSAGPRGAVHVWEVATGRSPREPLQTGFTYGIALRRDGMVLASDADNAVQVWDLLARKRMGSPLLGHGNPVSTLDFSPDENILASGDFAGTIRLWDLETGRPFGEPFDGHGDYVTAVAFSPDGKMLASASRDKTLLLWDVDPASWTSRACRLANRNLSLAEWQQYLGGNVPYQRTCRALPDGEGVPAKARR